MAEVRAFDPAMHVGRASETRCGQGGSDNCAAPPAFTVVGPKQTISACDVHLAGAVREADGMPRR